MSDSLSNWRSGESPQNYTYYVTGLKGPEDELPCHQLVKYYSREGWRDHPNGRLLPANVAKSPVFYWRVHTPGMEQ